MHGARGHDGFWPVQNLSDDEAITELCQPNSIAKFYDTEFFVLPVVSPTYRSLLASRGPSASGPGANRLKLFFLILWDSTSLCYI